MVTKVQNLGPLDWRIAIVTKDGRPTPEFQRRWASQRTNNGLIGFVGTGDGPPTDPPTGEGELYVDITSTSNILYVGLEDGTWDTVGVIDFVDLADVPHDYTASGGFLVQVTLAEDGLEFVPFGDHAADPTAVASDVAVNGVADTYMRSDSAPAVQLATTSDFGLVKPDGSSITITGGVISASGGGGGGNPDITGPSVAMPLLSGLTWMNQGGASAIQYTNGPISVSIPGGTGNDQLRGLYVAPPGSPPYTLTIKLDLLVWTTNFDLGGAFILDSGGKLLVNSYEGENHNNSVVRWNSVTSFNNVQKTTPINPGRTWWFRIYNDGTNWNFQISHNGADWIQTYSEGLTSFLGGTITGLGFYGNWNDQSGINLSSTFSMWSFECVTGIGTNSHW